MSDKAFDPILIGQFTSTAGTVTTSPTYALPTNSQCLRLTWRLVQQDFGPQQPISVRVMTQDGNLLWANTSIGPGLTTNDSYDILVPVLPIVDQHVQVQVSEQASTTHIYYVSSVSENAYVAALITGSTSLQTTRITQVGTNNAFTTFGELGVGITGDSSLQSSGPILHAAISLTIIASFTVQVHAITVSFNKTPTNSVLVRCTDTFGPDWQAYYPCRQGDPDKASTYQWTFPAGGMAFTPGANVIATVSDPGVGVTGILSTMAGNRFYTI